MNRFVEFKSKDTRAYIINIDHIIGIYPLPGETSVLKGGVVLVQGLGKEGANKALELDSSEMKTLLKQLGLD